MMVDLQAHSWAIESWEFELPQSPDSDGGSRRLVRYGDAS